MSAIVGLFIVPDVLSGEPEPEPLDEEAFRAHALPREILEKPPEPEPEAVTAAPTEEAPEETLAPDGSLRVVARFGAARGFRPALVGAGCTGAEADALVSALDGVMDFRRCRPTDELTVERDADGRLERFEYRASSTQIYEVNRDAAGALHGRQIEVPIERIRIRRGGTVQASLGAALERAGLGRTLVGTFVEAFEREVNFSTDTRAGDTFRIIVDEERVEGQLLRYGTVHAIEVRGQRLGERRAFWYELREGRGEFYDASGRALHGGWLRTPLRYDHISSPFDPRRMHPILRRIVPHNGIDYAAGSGTPVWAAADGVVTSVGPRGPNGNLVTLRHDGGFESAYAHLSRFAPGLAMNQAVEQRQLIGYVGTTGRSTGPHLHFGLKHHGRWVDPSVELNGPGRMMPARSLGAYRQRARDLTEELAAIPVTAPAGAAAEALEPRDPPAGDDDAALD
ncbi:MAG: M23 family metallopeptidase [Sandaracinaceae bacterium]